MADLDRRINTSGAGDEDLMTIEPIELEFL